MAILWIIPLYCLEILPHRQDSMYNIGTLVGLDLVEQMNERIINPRAVPLVTSYAWTHDVMDWQYSQFSAHSQNQKLDIFDC